MMNLFGQHFDLMKEGTHVLVKIPRWVEPSRAMLQVSAAAKRIGGSCADLYFVEINVTGAWVPGAHRVPGAHSSLQFQTERPSAGSQTNKWHKLKDVRLKVVEGKTRSGVGYLNIFVRNLAQVKYPVGGLLGTDDHSVVEVPPTGCKKVVSL